MPLSRKLLWWMVLLLLPRWACGDTPAWPDLSKLGTRTGGGDKDAAVLVAVENYTRVGKVPGAKRNLADWKHWLVDVRGVADARVFELTDDQVSPGTIRKKAKLAAELVQEGGTVWFVFIGHGVPAKDGGDAMLVTVDARQSDEVYKDSIGRREVLATLAAGRQARTIFVADSCFSGGKDHGGQDIVRGAQPLVALKDTAVRNQELIFSAGAGDQFAGPLPGEARPAYTYLLLGGLMGWADGMIDGKPDKKVTVLEANQFARTALMMQDEREQEPEFAPIGQGGAVLASVVVGPLAELKALMAHPTPPAAAMRAAQPPAVPAVVCPQGTSQRNGQCVVDQVTCPQGTRVEDGKCVAVVQCPAGTRLENGQCLAAVVCPGGAYWDGQRCVGTAAPATPSPPEGMVYIPAGTFTMGSPEGVGEDEEHPARQVTLTRGFYLDRAEVTVAEYEACVRAGPCKPQQTAFWRGKVRDDWSPYCNSGKAGRDDHPMNCVDWHQARAYCGWRGKALPSEAQWERAARGGVDGQTYVWGNAWPPAGGAGNFADATFKEQFPASPAIDGYRDGYATTAPVCQFTRNGYGLCDMAGNVWEWVADAYDAAAYTRLGRSDPERTSSDGNANRVLRGGSWSLIASDLRAAYRLNGAPFNRDGNVGFRCSRTL